MPAEYLGFYLLLFEYISLFGEAYLIRFNSVSIRLLTG